MDIAPNIERYMDLERKGHAMISQFVVIRRTTTLPTEQFCHISRLWSIYRRLLQEPSLSALSQALVVKSAVYEAGLAALYVMVLLNSRKTQARAQPKPSFQGCSRIQ